MPVPINYISGGIWRELFRAFIFEEGCYKGLRELVGAFIIGERSGEACPKHLYQRRDIMRGGESCLEYLYLRRDLERPVWSFYISEEI